MKTTTNAAQKIVTLDVDGVELSLALVNGGLRVASEGVDVGPVRGTKRLAGPQLAGSMAATKAIYRRLAASAEYRAYLAACAMV